ncbi:ShKT domain-containing protein [Aphelenchoides bicaudatus]|nr:ShKT domain-containing protein [Aphelenchoides bicaudatus]
MFSILSLLLICVSINIVNAVGSGSGDCEDLSAPGRASDCPGLGYLCQNATYQQLMAEQCKKTCGLCGGGSTTTRAPDANCKDKSSAGRGSDCPQMAAYCNNQLYANLMAEQCPKTCGKC